jgi:hypothetical protein
LFFLGILDVYWGHPQEEKRQKHNSFLVLVPFLEMFGSLLVEKNFLPELMLTFDEVTVANIEAPKKKYFKLPGLPENTLPEALSYHKCSVFLLSSPLGGPFLMVVLVPTKTVPADLLKFKSDHIVFLPSYSKG